MTLHEDPLDPQMVLRMGVQARGGEREEREREREERERGEREWRERRRED